MIIRTKHKTVLSLLANIWLASRSFLFFYCNSITSNTTHGKTREGEGSLNYGRCLQWYAKFEKKKFTKKLRQHQKSQDNEYTYIYIFDMKNHKYFLNNIKKRNESLEYTQMLLSFESFLIEVKEKKRWKRGEKNKNKRRNSSLIPWEEKNVSSLYDFLSLYNTLHNSITEQTSIHTTIQYKEIINSLVFYSNF
jgi:hypothetical protein